MRQGIGSAHTNERQEEVCWTQGPPHQSPKCGRQQVKQCRSIASPPRQQVVATRVPVGDCLSVPVCACLRRGLAAIGSKSKAKQLQEDEKTVTLQVGKSVFESAPRNMRTELWMSSLQRKGIGVAASQKYEDMLLAVSPTAAAASMLLHMHLSKQSAPDVWGAHHCLTRCLSRCLAGCMYPALSCSPLVLRLLLT